MIDETAWIVIGVVALIVIVWFFMGKSDPENSSPDDFEKHNISHHTDDLQMVEGFEMNPTFGQMAADIKGAGVENPENYDLIDDVNVGFQQEAVGPSGVQKMEELLESYDVSANPMFEEMAAFSYNPTPTTIMIPPRLANNSTIEGAVRGDVTIVDSTPRDVFRPLYGRRDATNKSLYGCNTFNLSGGVSADQLQVYQSQNQVVGQGPPGIGGVADVYVS